MKTKVVRIFIANNDTDDVGIFKSVVKQIVPNADIIHSENGEQLIHLLEEETPPVPNIIFLDLNMPVMNGYECLDKIRKNIFWKETPIIILSTSDSSESVHTTRCKGANKYISKPATYKEYKGILSIALNKNSEQLKNHDLPYYLNAAI